MHDLGLLASAKFRLSAVAAFSVLTDVSEKRSNADKKLKGLLPKYRLTGCWKGYLVAPNSSVRCLRHPQAILSSLALRPKAN